MDLEAVVLGDLMVDIVVTVDRPIAFGSDTPASITRRGGGSAANTAAWLASVGRRTGLIAGVGDDDAGRWALDDLADVGVDHLGPVVTGAATGTCVVVVDAELERTMFPDRGANTDLGRLDRVVLGALRPARAHVSGYALLDDSTRDVTIEAMRRWRRDGIPVSVDAASAAPIAAVGADTFLAWIDGVDELLANDDEAVALGGTDAILASTRSVVHKLGAAGAMWTDGSSTERVPAAPVDAVDTTGAGDAFAAGWISAGIAGLTVVERLGGATEVAAKAVARPGGRPQAP